VKKEGCVAILAHNDAELGPQRQTYIDKQTICIETKCCAPVVAQQLIP
jgi:hypothetical protein